MTEIRDDEKKNDLTPSADEPKVPPVRKKKKKKIDEKKMSFWEHLEELRWAIVRSLAAIFIGAVICFIFQKQLVEFMRGPAPDDLKLIFLSLPEGFVIYIKVALFGGFVLALPVVVYEFWKFIVPGLLEKERSLVPPIVFFTVLCFLTGGAFAYFIMIPFAIKFLLSFQSDFLIATITIGKYLGFVVTLILAFGAVFELPVLAFLLSKMGLLTPQFMRSYRRYSYVVIFIIAAVLTPPDVLSQMLLAIPLLILYEISIFVSAVVVRKKAQSEDEEED
jgi:sec-independent protein translocase protein TatC